MALAWIWLRSSWMLTLGRLLWTLLIPLPPVTSLPLVMPLMWDPDLHLYSFLCLHKLHRVSSISCYIPLPLKCHRIFSQVVPVNTALEISLHGKGSTTIDIALYMHTNDSYYWGYARVDHHRCGPHALMPSNSCRTDQGLEIKSCYGEISKG